MLCGDARNELNLRKYDLHAKPDSRNGKSQTDLKATSNAPIQNRKEAFMKPVDGP